MTDLNLGKSRIVYHLNWSLLANLNTLRKAWTVSIIHHVQLILVTNRRTRIEYYANKFSTLIPIKPLGLIVHGLCFLGVNVFAIECIQHKTASSRGLELLEIYFAFPQKVIHVAPKMTFSKFNHCDLRLVLFLKYRQHTSNLRHKSGFTEIFLSLFKNRNGR